MGYADLDTILRAATGDLVPAAWLDQVNDNFKFLSGAVGAYVGTSEATSSATFADLSTVGPSVTVATGLFAIVLMSALISNNTAGGESYMSFAVSGASTTAADVTQAVMFSSPVAAGRAQLGYTMVKGLNPGTNTFTAKYQAAVGTGTFGNRRIAVIPLP